MDTGTIVVACLFVSILLIPIVVINLHRKKLAKKWLLRLNQSAYQYNCSITMHEYSRHFAIGMDEKNGFVFFMSGKDAQPDCSFADLSAIKKVQVVKELVTGNVSKDTMGQPDQISLQFIPLNNSVSGTRFLFFDTSRDGLPSDEFNIAERWASKLNGCLANFKAK